MVLQTMRTPSPTWSGRRCGYDSWREDANKKIIIYVNVRYWFAPQPLPTLYSYLNYLIGFFFLKWKRNSACFFCDSVSERWIWQPPSPLRKFPFFYQLTSRRRGPWSGWWSRWPATPGSWSQPTSTSSSPRTEPSPPPNKSSTSSRKGRSFLKKIIFYSAKINNYK